MYPYLSIEERVVMHTNNPTQGRILHMIDDNRDRFKLTWGSVHNHQAWAGGWWDHYTDGLNVVCMLYETLSLCRPLPFAIEDAVVAFFAHDIEKPWKYDVAADGTLHHKSNFVTKDDANNFRDAKLREYGIILTPLQANGMEYAEGEIGDKYSNRNRNASELAALVHMADHCSARLWHEYPAAENDPWKGAQRIQSQK